MNSRRIYIYTIALPPKYMYKYMYMYMYSYYTTGIMNLYVHVEYKVVSLCVCRMENDGGSSSKKQRMAVSRKTLLESLTVNDPLPYNRHLTPEVEWEVPT